MLVDPFLTLNTLLCAIKKGEADIVSREFMGSISKAVACMHCMHVDMKKEEFFIIKLYCPPK